MPITNFTLDVSNDQLELLRTLIREMAAGGAGIDADPDGDNRVKLVRLKVDPGGHCHALNLLNSIQIVLQDLSEALEATGPDA